MRLTILVCCLVFSNFCVFAEKCSDKELSQFEIFLNDSKTAADLKYDLADKNLDCEHKTYKALSFWITDLLENNEEKQELCEETTDFCKVVPQSENDDKIYLIKRLELTVCKDSSIDFTINEEECFIYFPAN